ncbi:MAG: DUF1858 domain-containing protein [Nanoarchaeota archaeon]|nr:DUF1858 domain-containing protein [Nanoarchaeota archaeon]MBU1501579.1 DUF1858 domain-containing protein [Nanoarchaeota archaeon]MBU2459011.1 DUF1858 domain-containing protein [Nanoarchaeota archaeon]
MEILKSTPIKELIKNHPETIEVLLGYGLNCVNCRFSAYDTLESGLKIHGLEHELELILKDLNEVINKS